MLVSQTSFGGETSSSSMAKCKLFSQASIRGGSRGRVQGVRTLPWDDLRFSNTTGILQKKKKLCGLLVLKYSKRRVHPLLKKILDPPLSMLTQLWHFPFFSAKLWCLRKWFDLCFLFNSIWKQHNKRQCKRKLLLWCLQQEAERTYSL